MGEGDCICPLSVTVTKHQGWGGSHVSAVLEPEGLTKSCRPWPGPCGMEGHIPEPKQIHMEAWPAPFAWRPCRKYPRFRKTLAQGPVPPLETPQSLPHLHRAVPGTVLQEPQPDRDHPEDSTQAAPMLWEGQGQERAWAEAKCNPAVPRPPNLFLFPKPLALL